MISDNLQDPANQNESSKKNFSTIDKFVQSFSHSSFVIQLSIQTDRRIRQIETTFFDILRIWRFQGSKQVIEDPICSNT